MFYFPQAIFFPPNLFCCFQELGYVKNCVANIKSVMTFLLKRNLHHDSPHFLEQKFERQVERPEEGQRMWRGRVVAILVGDAQTPSVCREHFQVPGSAHVLRLWRVSVRTRPGHAPVLSPPPSLTPTPRRIAFELEANLDDWQGSPPGAVGGHHGLLQWVDAVGSTTERLNWEQKSACSVHALLQTVLRPESPKRSCFQKPVDKSWTWRGLWRRRDGPCLEVSSVREEGNWE